MIDYAVCAVIKTGFYALLFDFSTHKQKENISKYYKSFFTEKKIIFIKSE